MDIIKYQEEAINFINKVFESKHLSHAYIIEGDKGSGKMDVACYFCEMLFCENHNACGECDECLRIKTKIHPNIFIVEPIQDNIRKDQINSLIHEGQMTSVINPQKVYIIKDVEKMNKSSSNTLLKFLEEPNPNNYLILLTSNVDTLMDTISSRCQIIRLKSINKKEIIDLLLNDGVDSDTAFLLSELFGNYTDSIDAYNDSMNIIDFIYKMYNALSSNKDLYIEYYLNKQILNNSDYHNMFLQSLIIFIKEEMKYINNILV